MTSNIFPSCQHNLTLIPLSFIFVIVNLYNIVCAADGNKTFFMHYSWTNKPYLHILHLNRWEVYPARHVKMVNSKHKIHKETKRCTLILINIPWILESKITEIEFVTNSIFHLMYLSTNIRGTYHLKIYVRNGMKW